MLEQVVAQHAPPPGQNQHLRARTAELLSRHRLDGPEPLMQLREPPLRALAADPPSALQDCHDGQPSKKAAARHLVLVPYEREVLQVPPAKAVWPYLRVRGGQHPRQCRQSTPCCQILGSAQKSAPQRLQPPRPSNETGWRRNQHPGPPASSFFERTLLVQADGALLPQGNA